MAKMDKIKFLSDVEIEGKLTVGSKGLTYSLSPNETYATCTGLDPEICTDADIVIASTYEGKPVTSIGDYAFDGYINLESVVIPDSVESIGIAAFDGCVNLENIVIPSSVTSIGNSAFNNCVNLESIVIPDNVESISDFAFKDCTSLTSIEIPDSVTSIGFWAFRYCKSLTIYCEAKKQPDGWKTGWNADNRPVVWGAALDILAVNNKLSDLKEKTNNNEEITNEISDRLEHLENKVARKPSEGITYELSSGGTYAICTGIGTCIDTDIVIASTYEGKPVTDIGWSAFKDCTNLTSVVVPDSVTSIGQWAFRGCTSLASVTIPDSVISIYSNVFLYCLGLTIYCGAKSKPAGWDDYWNPDNRPVVWGISIASEGLANIIISELNHAEGYQNFAGNRAYKFLSIIAANGQTEFTLDPNQDLSQLDKLQPNDIVSIIFRNTHYDRKTKIVSISYDPYTIMVEGEFSDNTSETIAETQDLTPEFWQNTIRVPSKPSVGAIDLGRYAHVEGWKNNAYGTASHVEGYGNTADGMYTHAEGQSTAAVGRSSHAEGYHTVAFGSHSHAEGTNTQAQGSRAHAEGENTIAKGFASHAEGQNTQANGDQSHAEGHTSIADHSFSHASGLGSITGKEAQTVMGKYNAVDEQARFVVGVGHTDNTRANAFTAGNDGKYDYITIGDEKITEAQIRSLQDTLKYIDIIQRTLLDQLAPGEGLEFIEVTGGYAVSGIGTCTNARITIPKEYNGQPVIGIADSAFEGCKDITHIIIPDTVTSIGKRAFFNCTSLKKIALPDSLSNIEEYAFYNCSALEELHLPHSLTRISRYCFEHCKSLTSLVIPDTITHINEGAFDDCQQLEHVEIPNSVTGIGIGAFAACYNIKHVIAPSTAFWSLSRSSLESIVITGGEYISGFQNCQSLTTIVIENGPTRIYNYAFQNCNKLRSVRVSDSITHIGGFALSGCCSLEEIELGKGITYLPRELFRDCASLIHVSCKFAEGKVPGAPWEAPEATVIDYEIPDSLRYILLPDSTYQVSGYEGNMPDKIIVPSYINGKPVTRIGPDAFRYSKLVSIVLPNTIDTIKGGAFANCEKLTNVQFGSGVRNIGDGAFVYCTSLTNITIPDPITKIGYGTFKGCTNLTDVVLPSGLLIISTDAFRSCYKLKNVNLPDSISSIESGAFYNCYALQNVTLPSGLLEISSEAFLNCQSLTSIVIPDGVSKISYWAFWGCSNLQTVVIPASVTTINSYAFQHCTSLANILFRGSEEQWNIISKGSDWDWHTGDYTITYNYAG